MTARSAPLLLSIGILTSSCSLLGQRSEYEEAKHDAFQEDGNVQLRRYAPMVLVETTVAAPHEEAGNTAFRRLFKYISGNNASQDNIAMTTPVFQEERQPETWSYQFVLPTDYTLDDAPPPEDPRISVRELPACTMAVIRYSGRWSEALRQTKTAELRDWIREQGLQTLSKPRYATYDPPWTLPAFRRNEVLIEVAARPTLRSGHSEGDGTKKPRD